MELRVNRFLIGQEGIISRLLINGIPECYILENRELAIPAGEYPVTWYDSPTHGPCPQIVVPGRTYIEMHVANHPSELKGCQAPGMTFGNDYVTASGDACKKIFPTIKQAIDGHDPVTMIVH